MTELICIVCPRGCRLHVDEENGGKVTGNGCRRGEEYGKNELLHPTRVVTSTVRIEGGIHKRLPVKTDGPIPKEQIFEAMRLLDGVTLRSPVKLGQVVVTDILKTGVNFVAARDM